ncbi:hypothetical protein L1049_022992 [Liquidambar formosana]|uniref:RNase H type-1 domain-containing protein n=1 Tax=Liquidambar formosana TaxID=63359 RepID=A0AAP0WPN5_LIQFO
MNSFPYDEAGLKRLAGCFPVAIIEALAVRYALGFARDLGLHTVEVEEDSAEVIQALNSDDVLLTPLGLIVKDIHSAAGFFSDVVTFSHILCEGNVVAHGLARHAQNVDDLCVWIEEVPEFIRVSHLADLYH